MGFIKNYSVIACSLVFTFRCSLGSAIHGISNISTCVGKNVSLNWSYDNESEVIQVVWSKDTVALMFKVNNQSVQLSNLSLNYKYEHIKNGAIKLITVSEADSGTYRIIVVYKEGSNTVPIASEAEITVKVPPSAITYNITDAGENTGDKKLYTCYVNYSGKPTVDVKIKVGGNVENTASLVSDRTKSMDCCVSGDAVRCIGSSTRNNKLYCVNIFSPYGPKRLSLSPSQTIYRLRKEDDFGNINCSADCDPPCTYLWSKDEKNISSSSGFLPSHSVNSKAQNGTYTCTAIRPPDHRNSTSITLFVIYGPDSLRFDPKDIEYERTEDDFLPSIRCEAECYPNCSYNWKKGLQTSLGSRTLSLGTLKRNDGGVYTCTAENTDTKMSLKKNLTIYVNYGPDDISLSKGFDTVREGNTLNTRTCSADCSPACTYKWSKPNQSKANITNGSLIFANKISRLDAGAYTCTATNPKTNATRSAVYNLIVRYGPDDVVFSSETDTVNEGDRISSKNCSAACFPLCTYIWHIPDQSQAIIIDDVLVFEDEISRQDAGDYKCTAKNPATNDHKSGFFTLHIRYGPDAVSISPGTDTVDEGVHIDPRTCSAECVPSCTYTWNKPANSQADFINDTLLFTKKILRQDTGEYRCIAKNSQTNGSQSRSFTLHVRYFPDLNVSVDRGYNVLDKDENNVTLLCTASGEPDEYPDFRWIHIAPDNKTQIQTYAGLITGSQNLLVLQELSYMDSGYYRCNASNKVKDYRTDNLYAIKDIKLTKTGEPQIVIQSSQAFVAVDSNAELKISFYSNDDRNPAVNWFKKENDSRIEIKRSSRFNFEITNTSVIVLFYTANVSVAGFTSQLNIFGVTPSDLGVYEIFIKNSVGYNSTILNVSAAGPPEAPQDFRAILDSATDSSITLTWQSGFHGGGNQTFYIEFRKKGSTEWQFGLFVFGGRTEDKNFNAAVHNLSADTAYEFRIYSKNIFNQSHVVTTEGNTTSIKRVEPTEPFPVGAAAGGGVAAAAIVLVIVILVMIWKRRSKSKLSEDDSKKTILTPKRHQAAGNEDVGEVNLNPMYESSDTMQLPATHADEYAKVIKHSHQPCLGTSADVYSVVNKRKENDLKSGTDKKKKKDGGKKKPKTKREVDGIVYENAESTTEKSEGSENVYENPVCGSNAEKPSRTKNDDGLIYIEVEHPQKTDVQNKQPVIHGEDRTIYADVAYGQVGEQRPESDEEEK